MDLICKLRRGECQHLDYSDKLGFKNSAISHNETNAVVSESDYLIR